jgi:hypothetical protein
VSVTLEAPYDSPRTYTRLPSPDFEDEQRHDFDFTYKQAMDGTNYSYISTTDEQILVYTFKNIGRGKLLELIEFHKVYADSVIKLQNMHSEVWRVKFLEDQLEISVEGRAVPCGDIAEHGDTVLRFVGVKISG